MKRDRNSDATLRTTHRTVAGVTLVEMMFTVVVANIGLVALLSSYSYYHQQESTSRAESTALFAARTVLEEIKSSDFDTLTTQYNNVANDDPNGDDKGQYFSVAGLAPPVVGGATQNQGEIIWVRDEAPDEKTFGRDLGTNGLPYVDGIPDGIPDGLDINGDASRETTGDAFAGTFDLNLNGIKTDTNVLGSPTVATPTDAYQTLRCAIRVTYAVMGEIRQIEMQTQVTKPIK